MKKIILIVLVVISNVLHCQDTVSYMIETSDEKIFIMWERVNEQTQYNIYQIDSLGQKYRINYTPIKPVYQRNQIERIFGKDTEKICKYFGVKYPEQIRNEIQKNPDLLYIFQAIEPRLTLIYGNGFFDSNIAPNSTYKYEITYFDENGIENTYLVSPKLKAIDRPPLPPEKLNGDINNYNDVQLYWKDPEGNQHAGFNIYRSDSVDNNFKQINHKRILLVKNEYMPIGERYAFIDEKAENGKTYYYKVVSVNILGKESKPSNIYRLDMPAKKQKTIEQKNLDSSVPNS